MSNEPPSLNIVKTQHLRQSKKQQQQSWAIPYVLFLVITYSKVY